MINRGFIALGLWTTLTIAAPAAAQTQRSALIDQARLEFDDSVGVQLLMAALHPDLGAPDSLWAVAAYDLAGTLIRLEQQDVASLWLRWIARHGSAWPIDRTWYTSSLQEAYDDAVQSIAGTGADSIVTSWEWPGQLDLSSLGGAEVTGDADAPVILSVGGRTDITAASSLDLPPGTYTLIASAEGYEPARLTREVLPGVTTVLDVDLVPLLPADVEAAVGAKLVRVNYTTAGRDVCRTGLLASDDGLVLTSLGAVMGGTNVRVSTFDGLENVSNIIAADTARGLAVLQLITQQAEPIPAASDVQAGQYVWAVHFAGCDERGAARTRLSGWPNLPTVPVSLALELPGDAAGAPLVNRSGLLVGLVSGTTTVVPPGLTEGVLDRARRNLAAVQVTAGKGFPWKWVGAGVAAVGIGAVLAGGGGGGGGNGTPQPPGPTTGGLVITFPG